MKTLYELLGVCPDASDEALKEAYRRLAKMHHPDLNPKDPDAARRFRQIAAATAILRDPKRRAAYNQRLVRELQRRLDRAREQRRSPRTGLVDTTAVAAVMIGIALVRGWELVGPVSPPNVIGGTRYEIVQLPVMVATAQHEGIDSRSSNDTIQRLPAGVPLPPASTGGRSEVSEWPEQHCRPETGSSAYGEARDPLTAGYDAARFEEKLHCKSWQGGPAGERELNANERAALIRQAQELLASGDARGARQLSQRACRNPRSRCGPGLREG
jgi:hypothetical protein